MQQYTSNITDAAGNAVPFSVVTIYDHAGALAHLFSDSAGTQAIANPITCDALGRFYFFAANGRYTGKVTGNSIAQVLIPEFQLYDSADDSTRPTLSTLAASGGAALVGNAPAGNIAATTVQGALNELDTEKASLATLAAAGGAALVGNTPAGNVAATTVQGAINELDVEKASLAQLAASGGSAVVGNGGETVADSFNALQLADYTALRAYTGPRKSVYVTGYLGTAAPSGIAGMFVRDDSDTTTADNGGTVIVASNNVRWKRQMTGFVLPDWFGAVGNGTTDDTAATQAALSFALANAMQVHGAVGRNYKITAKLRITAGHFVFDGHNCLFTNAISNATAADPLFELADTSIGYVWIGNFRVNGTGNNGHIVSILGALSTGPQVITLERIQIQSNSGNGKDHNGNPIPAQLLYAYGGMTLRVKGCDSYVSGGIWYEQSLKVEVSGTTIDSPPAGRLLYLKSCNHVDVDGACVFNGGTTDQIEADSCNGVTIQTNRLKGGSGRQFYAHGPSTGITFEKNQQNIYALTSNAVEITTAVASPRAVGNTLAFINPGSGAATFTKAGIAIVDEPGGGFISSGAVIDGTTFIVNSQLTIASLISVGSSLNSVRGAHIGSNSLAAPGGGSLSTITKGIDLNGTVTGATVENNQYGATTGNTMVTGISVGSGCTGTRLLENNNAGNCTTPISDAGVRTTRIENGSLVPVSYTPVVSGLTTAGTATYSTQTGSYTRNGNLVNIDITVAWSGHTGTGAMVISLPFTCAAKSQVLNILSDSLTYSGTVKAAVSSGDNLIRLWADTSNAAASAVQVDAAATLYISGVLETA